MVTESIEPLSATFHALGDTTRRGMLELLARKGECTAGELGLPFRIAQPTASRHIRVLESAGLVSRRVDGRVHRFRLQVDPMNAAEDWLARHKKFWAASFAALEQYLHEQTENDSA